MLQCSSENKNTVGDQGLMEHDIIEIRQPVELDCQGRCAKIGDRRCKI